ncbi:MAG: HAD-IIIA family hydrolase [Alphaproteobacteria bacterium]|nr:HAD-IIIA family hydrolase [Alphaproteobacteria bacterium]
MVGDKPTAPGTLDQFEILPGVPEAVARLKNAGLAVIVVTNQPDVTRGKHRRADVDAIHKHLKKQVKVDAVYVCFCLEGPDCDCYKPKPGMLLEAARDWDIDLARSFMVGDRWRDVGAGKAAGCRTFFIDYGYRERQPENPDHVVKDLAGAVAIILDRIARE